MTPRDIILVRHAESEWNAVGRWQGQANPPLSERGFQQVRDLAHRFPDIDSPEIWSSDLDRALQTAQPLAQRFATEIIVDKGLRELDVGSWSGKTRAEIAAEQPGALDLWFQGVAGWDGGESIEEHEARVAALVSRVRTVDAPTLVMVTHGGTIRAIVIALLEIDTSHRWRLGGIDHTSVSHIVRGPAGYRLSSYNATLTLAEA